MYGRGLVQQVAKGSEVPPPGPQALFPPASQAERFEDAPLSAQTGAPNAKNTFINYFAAGVTAYVAIPLFSAVVGKMCVSYSPVNVSETLCILQRECYT